MSELDMLKEKAETLRSVIKLLSYYTLAIYVGLTLYLNNKGQLFDKLFTIGLVIEFILFILVGFLFRKLFEISKKVKKL